MESCQLSNSTPLVNLSMYGNFFWPVHTDQIWDERVAKEGIRCLDNIIGCLVHEERNAVDINNGSTFISK